MLIVDIPLPASADCTTMEQRIDEAIARCGLRVSLRGTLKRFPACIHWHVTKGGTTGTLEITLWPQEHRAWFSVQKRRTAAWIDAEIVRLGNVIQAQLCDG